MGAETQAKDQERSEKTGRDLQERAGIVGTPIGFLSGSDVTGNGGAGLRRSSASNARGADVAESGPAVWRIARNQCPEKERATLRAALFVPGRDFDRRAAPRSRPAKAPLRRNAMRVWPSLFQRHAEHSVRL